MRNTLYVGGFAPDTTPSALRDLLGRFGEIADVRMICRPSQEGRGFAYVTFTTIEAAESALALNGEDFAGLPLRVDFAR